MIDPAMQQFEWSVRALAQPAAVQLRLYPSFVEVADELALEFEEHLQRIDVDQLPPAQRDAVRALDQALEEMSGPAHAELWEVSALDVAPEWTRLRELASQVIAAMDWSRVPPPIDRGALYVGSDTRALHG